MGHDVYAYKIDSADQRDALYASLCNNKTGDEWREGYEAYTAKAHAAYNRRSIHSELKAAIYEALGAMDYYAGCSGDGRAAAFTREQIEQALKRLQAMRAEYPATSPTQVFDPASGKTVTQETDLDTPQQELDFMKDCLAFMDEAKRETITICFG